MQRISSLQKARRVPANVPSQILHSSHALLYAVAP
jgi:hypothetical protein